MTIRSETVERHRAKVVEAGGRRLTLLLSPETNATLSALIAKGWTAAGAIAAALENFTSSPSKGVDKRRQRE